MKEIFENTTEKKKFFENLEAEREAEKLYSAVFQYHNFSHAKGAVAKGRAIIENCYKERVPIDERIVYYANLFHDAGYHEDHKKKGFSSKEEYSSYLAGDILKKLGEDEEIISRTQSAILATHRDKPFITNEEKAVRASDLTEMADDYETFLKNTIKLKQEAEMVSGQQISWSEWKNRVKKIVEFYLNQDIRLTSFHDDKNSESIWHRRIKENLKMFLQEDEKIITIKL